MKASDQHLNEAIRQLQQVPLVKAPYAGLHSTADKNNNVYIGANKEGLITLAIQLLHIAVETDERKIDQRHAIASRLDWINHHSDIPLDYIEVREPSTREVTVVGSSLKSKIGNIGIVLVLLGVIVLILLGFFFIGSIGWDFVTGGFFH